MKNAPWVLFLLAIVMSCVGGTWLIREEVGPVAQEDLSAPRIYAYRDWQAVGTQLENGDVVHIRARGTWLYTPDELHGPEGHAEYPAPDTYPISGYSVPGGVLLGRIGEDGPPFIVGRGRTVVADRAGTLYFRINDDILSDNEGYVTVELQIEAPVEP
ncbi:MAG: hypothetical protein J7M39_14685 [Anaerolineae bacterium]|nr:hypothetical protein [Anaerolineae bacterium]